MEMAHTSARRAGHPGADRRVSDHGRPRAVGLITPCTATAPELADSWPAQIPPGAWAYAAIAHPLPELFVALTAGVADVLVKDAGAEALAVAGSSRRAPEKPAAPAGAVSNMPRRVLRWLPGSGVAPAVAASSRSMRACYSSSSASRRL